MLRLDASRVQFASERIHSPDSAELNPVCGSCPWLQPMGRLQKFVAQAAALASKSLGDFGSRHGAVIVKGGKVIASGFNSSRTRVRKVNLGSTHAEVAALSYLL